MRLALTALGFCLLAGSAFAQSSYDDRSRDEGSGNSCDSRSNDSRSEASAPSQRPDDWDQSRSEGRSPNARGASFYLQSGDKEFRIECDGDESTSECVDAALTLFREIQKPVGAAAMTPSSTPSLTGTGGGSTTSR